MTKVLSQLKELHQQANFMEQLNINIEKGIQRRSLALLTKSKQQSSKIRVTTICSTNKTNTSFKNLS